MKGGKMDDKETCCNCMEITNEAEFDSEGKAYCLICSSAYLKVCSDCGITFDHRDNPYLDSVRSERCPSCADEYFRCASCGALCAPSDEGQDGVCFECFQDEEKLIRGYHDNPNLHFLPDNRHSLYFGVELETDNFRHLGLVARELYALSNDEHTFYLMEDCSLSSGIEIISQPATLAYHQTQFPWREITRTVRDYNGKSEDTPTAALHIHFSKEFFRPHLKLRTLKLIYLVEKFWDNILPFARTSNYLLERSAKRYNDSNLLRYKPSRRKYDNLHRNYDRLHAINLHTETPTIEFRLFRGTLKTTVILASIELVDLLARMAKRLSIQDCQSATWADVLHLAKGKQYCYLSPQLEALLIKQQKGVDLCLTTSES